MTKIIISDTHFGVKQNSITWLNSQIKFLDDQLIPHLQKLARDGVTLIHCGDVFDSRSTISTYVATLIVEKFKEISDILSINPENKFVVVGGNHDYYSPVEDVDNINSLELFFRGMNNVKLITNNIYVDGEDMYVPWYEFLNDTRLFKTLKKYPEVKNIFTHADLDIEISTEKLRKLSDYTLYTGHLHTPKFHKNINILGSTYPLNFADSNSTRGYYVLDEKLELIPNKSSIQFFRIQPEMFDGDWSGIKKGDYIEIYVERKRLLDEGVSEKIKNFTSTHKNCTVIPLIEKVDMGETVEFQSYNIEEVIKNNIPNELKEKFLIITKENVDV